MREIQIGKNEENQRLDKFLLKYFNEAPSSFIYKMLRKKNITLNNKKATGKEKLELGDCVKLFLAEDTIDSFRKKETFQKHSRKLSVLYEDEHITIINKPAGMLSQKAKPEDISLVEYYITYLLETNQLTDTQLSTFRPSVCNRLDRNTSGIICCGKSLAGLQKLSALFKDRTLHKYYLAIVSGQVSIKENIHGYLAKDEIHNKVTIYKNPGEGRQPIETTYEPVLVSGEYSLIKIQLITGKTHQIRAHLASTGHGIIGDSKYGQRQITDIHGKIRGVRRQILHAYEIVFPSMTQELSVLSNSIITAPLPDDFKETLHILGFKENDYESKLRRKTSK